MNTDSHLRAGRRMHRIAPTELCCTGNCLQGDSCPRYASPIKPQPVIGTAPFVWTIVILCAAVVAWVVGTVLA